MKRATTCILLSTFVILSLPALILAQILNGGFEQWTDNTPDNWFVNNIPQLYTPVTQTNTSHSGSSALQGQVVNFMSTPVPPVIVSGEDAAGFPVSAKYLTLEGYYQFAPVEGDQFVITVFMLNNGNVIGTGALEILNTASVYAPFSMGISYFSELTPDTAWIEIAIINSDVDPHIGSQLLLDDISLSMTPTGIETANSVVPSSVILNQNYPNPFNPATTIGFLLPQGSEVSLTIYDITGAEVVKLVDRQNMAAGYHSIQWQPNAKVPSGVYFYRLTAGNFSQTRRTLYIK